MVKPQQSYADASDDTIVLKVSNWEEYLDEGDWDDKDTIDLKSESITSENGIVSDFEEWYYNTYGKHVEIEYSTFGTNEDLYSQLILGDSFDLICPSDYMIMKLMKEDMLQPLSDDFFNTTEENNYYTNGVSPYIKGVFDTNEIDGKPWSRYAAGYMWGVIGIVYNPEEVSEEDASTWSILINPKYEKQVTIKDSVRESYFPALAIVNRELLVDDDFRARPDYQTQLGRLMNDTSQTSLSKAEVVLRQMRINCYSFETDSGKSDLVTGKVVANLQWSGDGPYTLDQAEEEDLYLSYAVPKECTNLWFDGWVMLKSGVENDKEKQKAAEAFINFISRPDNVIRNMYYVGYTSTISGGANPLIYEYVDWCYGADQETEETAEYPLGYFFSGDNEDGNYRLTVPVEQTKRQLFAQYPTEDVLACSAVMGYFTDEVNSSLNQMWINIRCFNLNQISMKNWLIILSVFCFLVVLILIILLRDKLFQKRIKYGYQKVEVSEDQKEPTKE